MKSTCSLFSFFSSFSAEFQAELANPSPSSFLFRTPFFPSIVRAAADGEHRVVFFFFPFSYPPSSRRRIGGYVGCPLTIPWLSHFFTSFSVRANELLFSFPQLLTDMTGRHPHVFLSVPSFSFIFLFPLRTELVPEVQVIPS